MTQNIVNIGAYKYLVEHYDANVDMKDNQYSAEFLMLRNFTVLNNIIYDNDIYIIERKYFEEYKDELIKNRKSTGKTLAFPITNLKVNSYSNSYKKFNNIFNIYGDDINGALIDSNGNFTHNVYELYHINEDIDQYGNTLTRKLEKARIKCDKIKIYHPLTLKRLNMIVDICNYMNGINFHYLCKPIDTYTSKTENELKFNNETYSEYVEIYFPNLSELFKIDDEGKYYVYYKEDFNIIASTQNEKFINTILSNSSNIEHSELFNGEQVVPLNLLVQPYRIVEEYDANYDLNFNDTVTDDKKMFVKLYLKNNVATNTNNSSNINMILYPYYDIDETTNIYLLYPGIMPGYLHTSNESKFKLMSRTGFSDGIISIVTLFDYPNKSYFYNKAKLINSNEDNSLLTSEKTSPIKEAYKYYNNVDDHYYNLFINEEIVQELEDIDKVDSISQEIIQQVKEISNINYVDKNEILNEWKRLMKETILKEYEEEFQTPANFLGYKIKIATDMSFKHIIYEKNMRVNFNDLDDFAFKLNGIFEGWNEKPEQLLCKIMFYDRLLGIELTSNLVIITKEWFKYLINDNSYVFRLSNLSFINKENGQQDMNVIDLKDNKVNFINTIKCIVNKKGNDELNVNKINYNQKVIFKPIFYKVKDLQNISLRPNINQKIGINLSEYLSKIGVFKIVIENTEYVEIGRNNIFVIFEINSNNLIDQSGTYNLIDNEGNYISSGNWSIS